MQQHNIITNLLLSETRRRLFDEGIPRIKKCLNMMTETEIWYRPNPNTVSAGNLVLHLCGNVRQWIVSGIGGQPDVRDRDAEFAEIGPIPTHTLITMLDQLQKDVDAVLNTVTPQELTRMRKVQIYEESGLSILVHVVEHFSYHVGQITYMVKSRKDVDTGYYAGKDL